MNNSKHTLFTRNWNRGQNLIFSLGVSHEKTREVLIEEIRKSAKLEVRIDEIEKRIGYIDQLNYRIQSIEKQVAKEEG